MKFKMTNETYDKLKAVAQIWLPAIGFAYYGLSYIWNLPHCAEVVGTICLADAVLGKILGISTKEYLKDLLSMIDKNPSGTD